MNPAMLSIARLEPRIQWALGALRDLELELGSIPSHKIGTQWCLDRLAERLRLLAMLARAGVLN